MKVIIAFLAVLIIIFSCTPKKSSPVNKKVEIKKVGKHFNLYKDGEPYFINGAVGWSFLDELKVSGGNSLRTSARALDEAHKRGLTVMLNIPMKAERDGFEHDTADSKSPDHSKEAPPEAPAHRYQSERRVGTRES